MPLGGTVAGVFEGQKKSQWWRQIMSKGRVGGRQVREADKRAQFFGDSGNSRTEFRHQ